MTGHTGFLGGWVCAWLKALGAEPIGFSRHRRAAVAGTPGDLRDGAAVAAALAASGATVVLHLGAQALTRRDPEMRVETFETNVLGTLNVLEAVAGADTVEACVITGSSRTSLGSAPNAPGALDPYDASKLAAEALIAPYAAEGAIALARPGVLIGGGDRAGERLVPAVLVALDHGRQPELRTGRAVRPWLHVLEAASGVLWLAASLAGGRATSGAEYRFGLERPEEAVSVATVADRLSRLWSGEPAGPRPPAGRRGEGYTLDCRRAREELGWWPAWTFDEALEATVDWYKGQSTEDEQIAAYTASARTRGVRWALGGECSSADVEQS